MGKRGTVEIIRTYDNERFSVFLWTRYRGAELPQLLQKTLANEDIILKPPLLARELFERMLGLAEVGEDTMDASGGFTIAAHPQKADYHKITLDTDGCRVEIGGNVFDYEDFISLSKDQLANIYHT